MKRTLAMLLAWALFVGMDCQGGMPAGLGVPGSGSCVIDDGPGFTIELPCNAPWNGVIDTTAGLTYAKSFVDDASSAFFLAVVSTSAIESGSGGGIAIGDQGNLRFDGTFLSAHGDFLVLATIRLDEGDLSRAITMLEDGSLLRASIFSLTRSDDQNLFTFGTIDALNTDGSDVLTFGQEGSTTMLAPYDDEYIILDNNTVWDVSSSDRLQLLGWEKGDSVFSLPDDRFSFIDDAFLTKITEWNSVSASFVDAAEILTIVGVDKSSFCRDIELSDGIVWTACADKNFVDSLIIGETVALFEGKSGGTHIMQLSTGKHTKVTG